MAAAEEKGMGYYLVVGAATAQLHSSWPSAKAATHGVKGAWCNSYPTRAEAAAALAALALPVAPSSTAVYVDGSALLGQWSGCAAWFGEGDARNLARALPPPHTSPRAELQAVLLALEQGAQDCVIYSDNAFVVQAYQRGWPTAFAHSDLMALLQDRCRSARVAIEKVAGHAGVPGNEAADHLVAALRPGYSKVP